MEHVDEAPGRPAESVSMDRHRSAQTTTPSSVTCSRTGCRRPSTSRPSRFAARACARRSDALPERERRILELRFGFEGEPWTSRRSATSST